MLLPSRCCFRRSCCLLLPLLLLRRHRRRCLPAQVRGAEKVLFGLDDVVGVGSIVVVEGEMDKLALEEAGIIFIPEADGLGPGVRLARPT